MTMSGVFGLEKGRQAQAGQTISNAAGDCHVALTALTDGISTHAEGFKGNAAAGLAQALKPWVTSAQRLPAALGHYAQQLVQVDVTSAAADSANAARLTSSGQSTLNLH